MRELMQPQAKTATVADTEIFYLESGAGSPLVLVHGLGHSSTAWLPSIPELSGQRRVLALDLPGYGRSPAVGGAYDPAYFARIVVAFIESLSLGPVSAVGSSLGGLALVLAALERPQLFRKISLVDPLGFTTSPQPPLESALLALIGLWLSLPRTNALIRTSYRAAFFDPSRVDEGTVEEIIRRAANPAAMIAGRRTLHAIFRFSHHLESFHASLGGLNVPVQVMWGKNDPVLPARGAEVARRALPVSEINVLDRCGHLPHIEQPDIFCSLLVRFLTGG